MSQRRKAFRSSFLFNHHHHHHHSEYVRLIDAAGGPFPMFSSFSLCSPSLKVSILVANLCCCCCLENILQQIWSCAPANLKCDHSVRVWMCYSLPGQINSLCLIRWCGCVNSLQFKVMSTALFGCITLKCLNHWRLTLLLLWSLVTCCVHTLSIIIIAAAAVTNPLLGWGSEVWFLQLLPSYAQLTDVLSFACLHLYHLSA